MTGLWLEPTAESDAEIEGLAARFRRVGLAELLDDLDRRGRRGRPALLPRLARAVRRAYAFDAADGTDRRWWPQGVTTSSEAQAPGQIAALAGRRLVAVSWYAKRLPGEERGQGTRVTVYDVDRRRYLHVLLVVPTASGFDPLVVHAGGLVWCGGFLHVAATARGFMTCRLDDLLAVPCGTPGAAGHSYVLPVRMAYRAHHDDGVDRLRYSFLSVDRESTPPALVVGEYARGTATRRLVRFDLDPETWLPALGADGAARASWVGEGVRQMQGAVVARGRWHATVSRGPWGPGSVYAGTPGALREHRWAAPMGPEDLTWWPEDDELWSITEHPRRRWVCAMRRSSFDPSTP